MVVPIISTGVNGILKVGPLRAGSGLTVARRLSIGYNQSMGDDSKDAGLICVLMERFEKQRLPRALSLKEKVDSGSKLDSFDIEFLEEVFSDSNKVKPILDRHPEYQELAAKVIGLYHEITAKALENEQSGD